MKKQIYIFGACVLAVILLFYSCSKQELTNPLEKQTLTIGTSADYPPYAFVDATTGEIIGFEIDVSKEVCKRLNKKMEIIDAPFTSLIFNLLAETVDIIAAGMTPSPQRSKAVLFSEPHLENDLIVIVTNKNNPQVSSVEDLFKKQIGVNTGYTSDLFLSEFPGISLIKLKAPAELFLALNTGSVDGIAIAQSSLQVFMEQQKSSAYNFYTIPNSADTYALAVRKQNTALCDKINKALQEMKQDGMLQKIKEKWNLS